MPVIDAASPEARYAQVKRFVTERIETGEWRAGDRLPSESEFSDRLGISRMTVNRALRELSASGLITRAQGVGTFVAEPVRRAELLELRDIAEDIARGGHVHRMRVVTLRDMRADRELALAFDLRPGARLFHSVIVHHEDDIPIQVEERFVLPYFAPDYLAQDFALRSAHRHLSDIARPDEIEHLVFAIAPGPDLCALLDLKVPEPCLQLGRRTWVDGRVVMKGHFTHPGSRYSFVGRYRP